MISRRTRLSAALVLLPLMLSFVAVGCASPSRAYVPPPMAVETTVIGRSVQGRAIEMTALGAGDDVVLVIGAIHGNEPAGAALCRGLIDHLEAHPELLNGRRVLLVPVANPDGLAAGTRANARGVDLNRNFPTGNRTDGARHGQQGLSEPESRALYDLLGANPPSRAVSIHQPLRCIDYDGPARGLAARMSAACGLPVKKLGARPGSLGSYVGLELGLPIVTVELPRQAHKLSDDALWQAYGPAMLSAIEHPAH